jgi:hypothetical protein
MYFISYGCPGSVLPALDVIAKKGVFFELYQYPMAEIVFLWRVPLRTTCTPLETLLGHPLSPFLDTGHDFV